MAAVTCNAIPVLITPVHITLVASKLFPATATGPFETRALHPAALASPMTSVQISMAVFAVSAAVPATADHGKSYTLGQLLESWKV